MDTPRLWTSDVKAWAVDVRDPLNIRIPVKTANADLRFVAKRLIESINCPANARNFGLQQVIPSIDWLEEFGRTPHEDDRRSDRHSDHEDEIVEFPIRSRLIELPRWFCKPPRPCQRCHRMGFPCLLTSLVGPPKEGSTWYCGTDACLPCVASQNHAQSPCDRVARADNPYISAAAGQLRLEWRVETAPYAIPPMTESFVAMLDRAKEVRLKRGRVESASRSREGLPQESAIKKRMEEAEAALLKSEQERDEARGEAKRSKEEATMAREKEAKAREEAKKFQEEVKKVKEEAAKIHKEMKKAKDDAKRAAENAAESERTAKRANTQARTKVNAEVVEKLLQCAESFKEKPLLSSVVRAPYKISKIGVAAQSARRRMEDEVICRNRCTSKELSEAPNRADD